MVVENDLYTSTNSALTALNKLSSLFLRDDISLTEEQSNELIQSLSNILTINNIIDILTEDDEEDEPTESVSVQSDYMYGIGETCLLLDPFDNYRIFTLYTQYDKSKPLDLSDGQKLYIVFRKGTKEIRIPEYTPGFAITIDKTKGQVLFKITKKQVNEIIALRSSEFYITRIYESYSPVDDSMTSSDEEVIFSGYWGERNTERQSNYIYTIKTLKDIANQKEAALQSMVDSINNLVVQNTDLSENINKLEQQLKDLQNEYDDYRSKVEAEYPGISDEIMSEETNSGNTGKIIDSRTVLIDYSNVTDKKLKDTLDKLTDYSEHSELENYNF